MTRAAAWILVLFIVSLSPLPASAKCDQVITLDLNTRQMSPEHCVVKSGAKITLQVLHPNLFRDDYALTMLGTDYHVLSIPDALKGLVAGGTSSQATLELTPPKGADEFFALLPGKAGPPGGTLDDAYRQAYEVFKTESDLIRRRLTASGGADPAGTLLAKLVQAPDNSAARVAALEDAGKIARTWTGSPELEKSFGALKDKAGTTDLNGYDPDAAIEGLNSIATAFADQNSSSSRNWDDAILTWAKAYAVWRNAAKEADLKGFPAKHADACDANIQAADKWMQAASNKLAARQSALTSYITLASAAVDPRRTPAILKRETRAQGDEILAQVVVSPHGASADDQKNLPQRPGATYKSTILVTGRWVMDVTAGLSVTDLRQRNYVSVANPDTNVKTRTVREGSRDQVDLHASTFLEAVYTMRSPGFDWGIVIPAIGVTIGDPIRYLVGGGLQFGEKVRLNLLGGMSIGAVNVPSGENVNQPIVTKDLEVKSVVRHGWFGSAGFTIALPPKSGS